jgi:hypothetical protein
MQALMTLLRTKLGAALCGAILLGTMGALFGAASVWHPGAVPTSGGSANTGSITATATSGAPSTTPGATGVPQQQEQPTPLPTNTPASVPTAAPTNTPRSIPVGQTVDLHGTIGTINTSENTFILNITSGSATKVIVTESTQFVGSATSLQGLAKGWSAEVKGQMQSDGTFLAFVVNSDNGN